MGSFLLAPWLHLLARMLDLRIIWVLPAFTVLSATSSLAGIKKPNTPEVVASCTNVIETIGAIAGGFHYSFKEVDAPILRRSAENFTRTLIQDYSSYLIQSDVAQLEKNLSAASAQLLLQEYNQKRCSFYDKQTLIIKIAYQRIKFRILDPKQLAAQIIKHKHSNQVYDAGFIAKKFEGDFDVMILDKLKERFNGYLSYADEKQAADFVANQYHQDLKKFEDDQKGFTYERFLGAFIKLTDPHSDYLRKNEYFVQQVESFKSNANLRFELGVSTPHGFEISEITDTEFAESSKIKLGDILTEINSRKVNALSREQVTSALLLSGRSPLKLKFATIDSSKKLTDIREVSYSAKPKVGNDFISEYREVKSQKILKLTFHSLSHASASQVGKEILEVRAQGKIDSLILDFKDLSTEDIEDASSAISLAQLFIKRGILLQSRLRDGKIEKVDADEKKFIYEGPLVILMGEKNQGNIEWFAAALKSRNRALVVSTAERTTGLGVKHCHYDKTSGLTLPGLLNIACLEILDARGVSVQANGVHADIVLHQQNPETAKSRLLEDNRLNHIVPYVTNDVELALKEKLPEGMVSLDILQEIRKQSENRLGTFEQNLLDETLSNELDQIAIDLSSYFETSTITEDVEVKVVE